MKFDAHQYTIDAGWDFTSVNLTAARGVADEDHRIIRNMAIEQGFNGADADAEAAGAAEALLASCKERVFSHVSELLTDLYEVTAPGAAASDTDIAGLSIETDGDEDETADAALAEINAALAPDYIARWTGNGNGSESDVVIEFAASCRA